MNTQTERLDNHTARLTVEVEPERLEQAKQTAAKNLAKRLNIPGFRKGKAPYRIIVNYVGEAAILEDAVEVLGNDIYPKALDESAVQPYGPGSLEDFKVEDKPVFTFVVPLQPTVELNDYRSVSVEYTAPEVTDADVDRSLRALREQEAVVEESQQPVALGSRITAYIDGRLVGDEDEEATPAAEAEAEAEEEHDHDHEHEHEHDHDHDDEGEGEHAHHVDDKTVIHEHNAVMTLDEEGEPAPGFADALVGAAIGDHREFELTYPEDEEYGELAGKQVKFAVDIQKIENVTLPALNDDFAARVTADEETPLTLLELRLRMRENLVRSAQDRTNNEHSDKALTAIVEQATISYPEAMIGEETDRFLQRFDQDLRQRGITLDDYMRIYRKSREDLYADYRETAIRNVERALVLREVAAVENVTVSDEDVDAEIDRNASQFGMRAEEFRSLYSEPAMRNLLVNDLLSRNVLLRISAIARGEAPELTAVTEDAEPAEPAVVTEDAEPAEPAVVTEAAEPEAVTEDAAPVEPEAEPATDAAADAPEENGESV